MISPFRGVVPSIDPKAFVTASAVVIGDVAIGAESSVWFHSVVRADVGPIRIGARTNLQDHVIVHVLSGGRAATVLGDDVTIGHRVILHGCAVGNRTLIGMGSVLLDDVEIGEDCLVGAGSLVTPGTKIPAGRLVLGNPARVVRELRPDEREGLLQSAANYVAYAAEYKASNIR